jgi:uncharacterized protein
MFRIPLRSLLTALGLVAVFITGGLVLRYQVATGSTVAAPAKAPATNHTLSVSGHGEVKVAPDMATITLGVQTTGDDAQSALSNNAGKLNAVVAAIKDQGVPASHIQTSDLSLYYDSQQNRYVVQHSLTIVIDDIAKVGSVIDAAVAAGANNGWGVSFGLKDTSAAHAQALQAAIGDSRSHADAMASALNVGITGVGSASEATFNQPIFYGPQSTAAAPASTSTQVQPGHLTVTADVSVVYTFG